MKNACLILWVFLMTQSFSAVATTPTETGQYAITSEKINEQVYVLSAAYSETSFINSAIVIGDNGVLLITAQMEAVAPSLETKINELTNKPITHVFNPASDYFHYDANDYFKERGAQSIAHEALKYTQASTDILFDDFFSMSFGDEVLTAHHTLAHNNAQTIV